jgi:hypothetical protein
MTNPTPIDITSFPELARIVAEVEATKTPRKLVLRNKPVAVISPVKAKKQRGKTKADYDAFRAAAGSWSDVDTDTLLKNIYEDRRRASNRPPVKL